MPQEVHSPEMADNNCLLKRGKLNVESSSRNVRWQIRYCRLRVFSPSRRACAGRKQRGSSELMYSRLRARCKRASKTLHMVRNKEIGPWLIFQDTYTKRKRYRQDRELARTMHKLQDSANDDTGLASGQSRAVKQFTWLQQLGQISRASCRRTQERLPTASDIGECARQ